MSEHQLPNYECDYCDGARHLITKKGAYNFHQFGFFGVRYGVSLLRRSFPNAYQVDRQSPVRIPTHYRIPKLGKVVVTTRTIELISRDDCPTEWDDDVEYLGKVLETFQLIETLDNLEND
jgi:hypothetical protein